jgi:hypothetical protein
MGDRLGVDGEAEEAGHWELGMVEEVVLFVLAHCRIRRFEWMISAYTTERGWDEDAIGDRFESFRVLFSFSVVTASTCRLSTQRKRLETL